jgi:hypothetical protein
MFTGFERLNSKVYALLHLTVPPKKYKNEESILLKKREKIAGENTTRSENTSPRPIARLKNT